MKSAKLKSITFGFAKSLRITASWKVLPSYPHKPPDFVFVASLDDLKQCLETAISTQQI